MRVVAKHGGFVVAGDDGVVVRHQPGAVVEVKDAVAAHLLAVGLAEEAPGKPAVDEEPVQDEKPAPRRRSPAK